MNFDIIATWTNGWNYPRVISEDDDGIDVRFLLSYPECNTVGVRRDNKRRKTSRQVGEGEK